MMRWWLFLFISLYSTATWAQTDPDFQKYTGTSLLDAISSLDDYEGIAFSYNPDLIANFKVPDIPENVNSVDAFLTIALKKTGLSFKVISGTYVIFSKSIERKERSISGVVRDKWTKEALPYATIKVKNSSLSTISNTDGKFSILSIPAEADSIQVSYIGYKPQTVPIRGATTSTYISVEMEPQQRNLPSVEITARVEKLIELDKKPSQLTFNPAQLSKIPSLGETDLFSALRKLPGIAGAQDAESGLRLRGGESDQTLVLFDGITVYHVDHFFGFLSAFNSNVVKNIQVYKGGAPAKYGGRAAGVVDITGIDGNKVNPSVTMEANLLSANMLVELPMADEKASLVVGFRRAYTDVIQTNAYQKMFNNIFNSSLPNTDQNVDVFDGDDDPVYSYYDLNAKFNFKPTEKDAFSLNYYQGADDVQITFRGNFENLERISNDDTKWGNRGGSVKWSRKWNKRWFTYLNLGKSNYRSDLRAEESFFRVDDGVLLSQLFFDQRVDVSDLTLRFDNTWEASKNTKLDFGYWATENKISLQAQNQIAILQDSLQEATTNAFYADVSQRLGRFDITGGLRATIYSNSDEVFVDPRLSATYSINEFLTAKAAYGIHRQMIRRLNERSLYLSIPETWTLASDETVPILRSDHYIGGATFQRAGWTIDLEGFHKDESGTVEYLYPEFGSPVGNLDQFAIGGERKIWGLEFMTKYKRKNHGILVGYTYIDAQSRYDEVNNGAYFTSSGISEHELNLVYSFEHKRWDFSAAFVLASGTPYTPVLGTFVVTLPSGEQEQFISLGQINSARLDMYQRLDVEGSYTVPLKKGTLEMGVSVYNLYDNQSVKFIDYFEIPIEGTAFYTLGRKNVYTLGITPSIFVKLRI